MAAVAPTLGLAALIGSGALIGCQAEYRSNAKRTVALVEQGEFALAADDAAAVAAERADDEQNGFVYELEAARTAQMAGRWSESAAFFEAAQARIRPYLEEKSEAKVTEAVATTLVNQTTAIYHGTPNERIMLSTLQSLDAMALGDWSGARVRLRRAQEWQQDAVARYRKAATQARNATDAAEAEEGINASSMVSSAEFTSGIAEAPGILRDLQGYGDYANPFSSWLRAMFLCYAPETTWQDRANGRTDLLHAASMLDGPARAFVERQLQDVDSISPTAALPPTWFIVQFAGLAPHKEEWKLTLPLPINGTFVLVTAAYPYIAQTGSPVAVLDGSVTLADFDRIVSSEFDEIKGIIYAQETLSASVKAVSSYVLQQSAGDDGGWVALAMAIYQVGTQAADLRSWRTLPRAIHVVAVPTPESGVIPIAHTGGAPVREVQVAPGSSGLVVITTPSAAAHPQVSTIPFAVHPVVAPEAPLSDA